MTLGDRCEREVRTFHEFIEDWLTGRIPRSEERYARAETAVADQFEITSPSGETRASETLLTELREAWGTAGEEFEIRVENTVPRFVFRADGACLVTYEEHQLQGGEWTTRYSTAVFRVAPEAPNGVEWIHLQETARSGGGPD